MIDCSIAVHGLIFFLNRKSLDVNKPEFNQTCEKQCFRTALYLVPTKRILYDTLHCDYTVFCYHSDLWHCTKFCY